MSKFPPCQGHRIQECQGIFFSAVLILVLVLAGGACKKNETLQLAGTTERRVLELSAPISEIIVGIPVQEGQRVQENDLVNELGPFFFGDICR